MIKQEIKFILKRLGKWRSRSEKQKNPTVMMAPVVKGKEINIKQQAKRIS